MNDSIAKDVWFLVIFGVLPAAGAMFGSGYIGGWVIGGHQPWGGLVVIAGVLLAFGLITLAMQLIQWAIDENAEIRFAEYMKRFSEGDGVMDRDVAWRMAREFEGTGQYLG